MIRAARYMESAQRARNMQTGRHTGAAKKPGDGVSRHEAVVFGELADAYHDSIL